VKRAFTYRFCPTDARAAELSRTFGCVRKVYSMALQARTEAWTLHRERVGCNATSAMLTAWKKTGPPQGRPRPRAYRHDRDVNAARNILAAGLAVAACGDGARPQRSTPGGQSSLKQEAVPPPRTRAAAQAARLRAPRPSGRGGCQGLYAAAAAGDGPATKSGGLTWRGRQPMSWMSVVLSCQGAHCATAVTVPDTREPVGT